jgi:hypothetical protein
LTTKLFQAPQQLPTIAPHRSSASIRLSDDGPIDRDGIEARKGKGERVRTAATLPDAEIAPTVRLDCRRAFLNMVTGVYGSRESWRINCPRN